MKHEDQVEAFCNDLDALVNRYINEFDLIFGDIVAGLAMKKHQICAMSIEQSKEEQNDGDDVDKET